MVFKSNFIFVVCILILLSNFIFKYEIKRWILYVSVIFVWKRGLYLYLIKELLLEFGRWDYGVVVL